MSAADQLQDAPRNVVLDLGSRWTRAGVVGEPSPRQAVRTTQLPDDVEQKLRQIFSDILHADPKKCNVVILSHPAANQQTIQRHVSCLTGVLKVLKVVCAPSPACVSAGSKLNDAMVIDIGWDDCRICPVVSGVADETSASWTGYGVRALISSLVSLSKTNSNLIAFQSQPKDVQGALEDVLFKCGLCLPSGSTDQVKDAEIKVQCGEIVAKISAVGRQLGPRSFLEAQFVAPETLVGDDERSILLACIRSLQKVSMDAKKSVMSNIVVVGGGGHISGLANAIVEELKCIASQPNHPLCSIIGSATIKSLGPSLKCAALAPTCFPSCNSAWCGASTFGNQLLD